MEKKLANHRGRLQPGADGPRRNSAMRNRVPQGILESVLKEAAALADVAREQLVHNQRSIFPPIRSNKNSVAQSQSTRRGREKINCGAGGP